LVAKLNLVLFFVLYLSDFRAVSQLKKEDLNKNGRIGKISLMVKILFFSFNRTRVLILIKIEVLEYIIEL